MKPRRFVASYSEGTYDKYQDFCLLRFIDFYKFCRGAENRGAPRSSNIDHAYNANGNANHASADRLNHRRNQFRYNPNRQFDARTADHDHHSGLRPKLDDHFALGGFDDCLFLIRHKVLLI